MKSSKSLRTASVCIGLMLSSTNAVSALCTGSVVPTPHIAKPNAFSTTFATSPNDVWAAGTSNYGGFLEHWNGARWTRAALPDRTGALEDISGVTTSDIWAVGSGADECSSGQAAAVHWDGAHWMYVSPNVCADEDSNLTSVAVVKPKDVWAVGVDIEPGPVGVTVYHDLVLHWTGGRHWTRYYDMPNDPQTSGLTSVRAVAANDIWAVGNTLNHPSRSYDLIHHFDGADWSDYRIKNPALHGYLRGLGVVGADDVWAVGGQARSRRGPFLPLIAHWNGGTWSVVPHASAPLGSSLSSVVAISTNDVWAVGSGPLYGSHVEHWNGSEWSTIPTDFLGTLTGLGAIPGTQSVWAVGNAPSQLFGEQSLAIDYHC